MKFAFSIGGREFSFGATKTSLSPDSEAWLRAEDLDDQQRGAKLVTPYAQSAWVYVAVSILAQSVAQIPFRISRMGGGKAKGARALRSSAQHRTAIHRSLSETIIESGDVVDLFNRPHPTMDATLFWEMVVTWNTLRGEFFILPMDNEDMPVDLSNRNPRVERMITLPTELFWHIVSGYELQAWRYTGSPLLTPIRSQLLLPTEIIHSRSPNPYLYWRGMSPLIVALVPAQTDFAGEQYQKGLWINNADTGVIVTTDQQVTPEQRAQILSALRERKRKAGTADRPLFLWGGAKVEKPTLSMMDMQFLSTREFLRSEIFSIFKVPETMAGFNKEKSSSLSGGGQAINAEKMTFYESTLFALCDRLENAVAPVIRTFGEDLIGWFDIDSLPIMQEARRGRIDTAVKAFGIGVSFNDLNKVYDLGFPEYPGFGDKNYLPFSLQDANAAPEPMPAEGTPEQVQDENDQEKSNPFSRMLKLLSAAQSRKPDTKLIWESHIKSRRKSVKAMQAKVSKVLNEFRGRTLAKLSEIHLDKSIEKRSLIDLIFDQHAFGAALVVELHNPIISTLQLAGDELNQELGIDDPWKLPPQKAKDFINKRTQEIMGIGGTVRAQLNTSLEQGLDNGESVKELADRVRAVFNNLNEYESRRVAMTETNIAYSFSRHEAMASAGVSYKAWLSSHGPHVREAHAEAEETYIADPIPLDQPFVVGGEELMYPGDDSLGASLNNIINCQCIQLASRKKSEDSKSITYEIFGALAGGAATEMTFSKN